MKCRDCKWWTQRDLVPKVWGWCKNPKVLEALNHAPAPHGPTSRFVLGKFGCTHFEEAERGLFQAVPGIRALPDPPMPWAVQYVGEYDEEHGGRPVRLIGWWQEKDWAEGAAEFLNEGWRECKEAPEAEDTPERVTISAYTDLLWQVCTYAPVRIGLFEDGLPAGDLDRSKLYLWMYREQAYAKFHETTLPVTAKQMLLLSRLAQG